MKFSQKSSLQDKYYYQIKENQRVSLIALLILSMLFSLFSPFIGLTLFFIVLIFHSVLIVNSQEVILVERLGKYYRSLQAGIHCIIPIIDTTPYRISLKEIALVVSPQPCFTKDNLRVMVNGILYYKVFDAKKAVYNIEDFKIATIQLAQTSMRSVIGQMLLDQTFQDRENINRMIIINLDEASSSWGIKVTRYEIQEIGIPESIREAMEYQVKAEREKRAMIANSEGEKASKINHSLGQRMKMINLSEGHKQKSINEAEGKAFEIKRSSEANTYNLEQILHVLTQQKGEEAFALELISNYIKQVDNLISKKNKVILPLDLMDISFLENQMKQILKKELSK